MKYSICLGICFISTLSSINEDERKMFKQAREEKNLNTFIKHFEKKPDVIREYLNNLSVEDYQNFISSIMTTGFSAIFKNSGRLQLSLGMSLTCDALSLLSTIFMLANVENAGIASSSFFGAGLLFLSPLVVTKLKLRSKKITLLRYLTLTRPFVLVKNLNTKDSTALIEVVEQQNVNYAVEMGGPSSQN